MDITLNEFDQKSCNRDYAAWMVIFYHALPAIRQTIRNGYNLDDTYVAQDNPRVMKGLEGIPDIFTSLIIKVETILPFTFQLPIRKKALRE